MWPFPPAPLPELLWVPVLLVPLRDLLRGVPLSRSANPQPGAGRRPVPSLRTPPFPAPAGRTPVEKPVDGPVTVGKPMFDPETNECVFESLSCIMGRPAKSEDMKLCNAMIAHAEPGNPTDLDTKKRITVAAFLSAAHTCE